MQRSWKQAIIFLHPASGNATTLKDTAAAVTFFNNHWAWPQTPEFFAAAGAYYLVLDDGLDPEKAYHPVRIALESVEIRVR